MSPLPKMKTVSAQYFALKGGGVIRAIWVTYNVCASVENLVVHTQRMNNSCEVLLERKY